MADRSARQIDLSLARAIEKRDQGVIKELLARGANPSAIDRDGRSMLTLAVEGKSAQAVEQLLNAGADPNRIDARGNAPLQIAQAGRQNRLSKLLLERGAVQRPQKPVRQREKPLLMTITGPSAAKAAHPSGRPYASIIERFDVPMRSLTTKERLELMRKLGHIDDGKLTEAERKELDANRSNLIIDDKEYR